MQLSSTSIRRLRCRLGWSRSELAHKLGVQTQLINDWETGTLEPCAEHAQVLENLFRRTESAVLEMLEAPHAEKMLEAGKLETLHLRDLLRDKSDKT